MFTRRVIILLFSFFTTFILLLGAFAAQQYFRAERLAQNLNGADLRGANLEGAKLRGADLTGANLTRADLRGVNLTGATLRSVFLDGANLSGADLHNNNLSNVGLTGADLTGANLKDANLMNVRGLTPEQRAEAKERGAIVDELAHELSVGDGTIGPKIKLTIPVGFTYLGLLAGGYNDVEYGKKVGDQFNYNMRIRLITLESSDDFEKEILRVYYGFDDESVPESLQLYAKSSLYPVRVHEFKAAGLNGYYVNTESEGGTEDEVFLEDRQRSRIIIISAYPTGSKQWVNLEEFLGIVESLKL